MLEEQFLVYMYLYANGVNYQNRDAGSEAVTRLVGLFARTPGMSISQNSQSLQSASGQSRIPNIALSWPPGCHREAHLSMFKKVYLMRF